VHPMTQTQQDPSQASKTAGAAAPASADGGGDDPLAHLHRMSTTAGLGSGEYVAINGAAVFALIVGIVSALCLFEETLFIVIPLVGVITAMVALRQIARSNGTQTGRGLAVIGLVLSIAFGGWMIYRKATERSRQSADRAAIESLIKQYGDTVRDGKFDQAYGLFSSRFAERVPLQTFTDRMRFVQEAPTYGKLKGATWNGLAEFETDPTTGAVNGIAAIMLEFEKAPRPIRQDAFFHKDRSEWRIENLPEMFPPEKGPDGAPGPSRRPAAAQSQ
jgi:hypothetical protein